jgi:hypothetical protein
MEEMGNLEREKGKRKLALNIESRREKMKDNEPGEIKGNSALKNGVVNGVDILDIISRP